MDNRIIFEQMPSGVEQPKKPWMFFGSTALTVILGGGLGVAAILALKQEPQAAPEPEVRIVKERLPAPPPKIVYKDRIVEKQVIKEVRVPVPTPSEQKLERTSWEGVWRHKSGQLPMFKLKATDKGVAGIYAPNWSTVLQFKEGKVLADGVEVVVDDGLFRVHFRLKVMDATSLVAESWVTDEDWLISLARGNQQARTPEQAATVRGIMEQNAVLARKRASLGTFLRGTEN